MEPYEIELPRPSITRLSGTLAIEDEEALSLLTELASIRAGLAG